MQIRQEEAGDEQSIGEMHRDTFRRTVSPEAIPPEVDLVSNSRASSAWIPTLSLVAVTGEQIVGHVMCSRAHVETTPVLALGPLGVNVAWQNRGIGTHLMRAVIGTADEIDEPLIGLLGSQAYYRRFGFAPSSEMGIGSPDPQWGDDFQTLRLAAYLSKIKGRFEYAKPFLVF